MTLQDKIMDFSLVWKQAATAFPYFDRAGVNWDDLYREYLGKAVATASDREHFLLLAEFLNRLGDGHTDIQFPGALLDQIGRLPFSFLFLRERYYVNFEEVLEINNQPMQALLNRVFPYVYHVGNFVPLNALHKILPFFLELTGNTLVTTGGSYTFDLLNKAPELPERTHLALAEYGDILHVQFNSCMYAEAAQEIKEALPGKRAVILDVRENVGGMTHYGAKVAELFISGEFHGCQKRTQAIKAVDMASASQFAQISDKALESYIHTGLCTLEDAQQSKRIWNHAAYHEYIDTFGRPENKALFDGPVVLLTSRKTISAAEDFTAMFRSNHRATIIGTPTCGTSGTTLLQPLSSGHARICSVGYRLLDGTEFIGRGIQPDVYLEPTIEDVRQGRDVVLEYALNCE